MRIILFTSPKRHILLPLGLASIAAILEQKGHKISICDVGMSDIKDSEVIRLINREQPGIIGFTSTTSGAPLVYRLAGKIKKAGSQAMLVMGGPHATALPDEVLKETAIDCVVRGEGDLTVSELAEVVEGRGELDGIKGISFNTNGTVSHNQQRESINDLDILPFPAKHLFPIEFYQRTRIRNQPCVSPLCTIMTSRGCPYKCVYCASHLIHKRGLRLRSINAIVDEIESTSKKFHINNFNILDDTFTLLPDRVADFCEKLLKKSLNLQWRCSSRVDMKPEIFKIMKRSGCQIVEFGVESGDAKVLGSIGKEIKVGQIQDAFAAAKKAGLMTQVDFMIGHIDDTLKTVKRTIIFAKKLRPDFLHVSITTPFPGTKLFDDCKKNGYLMTENWKEYDYCNCVINTHKINPATLIRYRNYTDVSFRLYPHHLAAIMRACGILGLGIEVISAIVMGLKSLIFRKPIF